MRNFILMAGGLLIFVTGCSPEPEIIRGTVTYQQKRLNSGRVYFNVNGGKSVRSAPIDEGGTYAVEGLDQGLATVAIVVPVVTASPPNDPTAPVVEAPKIPPVEIPKKFGKVETSGLTYQVVPGSHTFDIELK